MSPIADEDISLALLNAVAREPTPTAMRAFDEFFYERVKRHIHRYHRSMGGIFATAQMDLRSAPPLRADQVDEAAHVTALRALRRARASASQFDPEKGSAEGWVLRSASFAFVEVAKEMAGINRVGRMEIMESSELEKHLDESTTGRDPAQQVIDQEEIVLMFAELSDDERRAALLCWRFEFSYAGAAEVMFNDPGRIKRIDKLLQQARVKLRAVRSQEEAAS